MSASHGGATNDAAGHGVNPPPRAGGEGGEKSIYGRRVDALLPCEPEGGGGGGPPIDMDATRAALRRAATRGWPPPPRARRAVWVQRLRRSGEAAAALESAQIT